MGKGELLDLQLDAERFAGLIEMANRIVPIEDPAIRAFAGIGALTWELVQKGWEPERIGRALAAAVTLWGPRNGVDRPIRCHHDQEAL